jgi:serine protease Do
MRTCRTILTLLAVPMVAMADTTPSTPASTTALKWDIARTTAPKNVAELKALQASVKAMVEKVTPATVAIRYGGGAGSGVIVSKDGLILTAAHVVSPSSMMPGLLPRGGGGGRENADTSKARIMLPDGEWVEAKVLGRNLELARNFEMTDSAMLRITGKVPKTAKWPGAEKGEWPAVELGDSEEAKVGQWVVSLGHPGGPKEERRPPVRLGQIERNTSTRLVSDCTLVGGDSGGPLFDLNGKLLGIHTSIREKLTDNYHVPVKLYQRDWDRLVKGVNIGRKPDVFMGVVWKQDPDDKEKAVPVIEEITKKSPAEESGLQPGDKVIKLNGKPVKVVEDVDEILWGTKAGQRIEIHVQRGQDVYELEITLARRGSR